MKVFYDPRQSVRQYESFSPSARKPKAVVDAWKVRFGRLIETVGFDPLSVEELSSVHEGGYVRSVMEGRTPNGFGDFDPNVTEATRWTTGSMVAAALHAYLNQEMAVSPTSGFHHAGWDAGGGYCTFNGLMLAAEAVIRRGARKVAIFDADMHFGNGTEEILEVFEKDWGGKVVHRSVGGEPWTRRKAPMFLRCLNRSLVPLLQECDLLIYQAGADPHVNDPLGGWLTTEQMKERDRLVFQTAKDWGVPVAWNLAGGYQSPLKKVVDLHVNTMDAAIDLHE